jgi:2'-5' RNA ligase
MAAQENIVAYWLCPAQPDGPPLTALIQELAARFDAPVFEPHVTLYVTEAEREDPPAVLEQITKEPSYRLTIRGLDYSEKFTKTLFIQFEPDAGLDQLSADLRRASAVQNEYELNPHLSLIYKEMDEKTKRELAHNIVLPFREVLFDSIKAVISPAQIESKEDVEAWRIVAEKKLTG